MGVVCRERDAGAKVTFSKEAVTDANGMYSVAVDGDHEDEVCEVKLLKSSRADCSEVDTESHLEQASRISITNNNGIVSPVRTANPLGFLKTERLPECGHILLQLGLHEDGSLKH